MQYKIWDLDGTVIDSSHRYSTLPNGDIDLPRWIADNTKANIEQRYIATTGAVDALQLAGRAILL